MTTGLLDTSTLTSIEIIEDRTALPDDPLSSAVTLAELSVGPLVATDPVERSARQARLQQAESDFVAIPFDADAARAFDRVAAALRASGRKPSARAFDAMIAATALATGLPVHTCNPRDFDGTPGLRVVSVEMPPGR